MDKDHTLTDGLTDALWTLLVGVFIFGAFRLLMFAYMVFTAVVWAICSELILPLLRATGIAMLRAYNRITSFFA